MGGLVGPLAHGNQPREKTSAPTIQGWTALSSAFLEETKRKAKEEKSGGRVKLICWGLWAAAAARQPANKRDEPAPQPSFIFINSINFI